MNTSKRRIFAGAIALTLVAAACGSDDDATDETTAVERPRPAGDRGPGDSDAPATAAPATPAAPAEGGIVSGSIAGVRLVDRRADLRCRRRGVLRNSTPTWRSPSTGPARATVSPSSVPARSTSPTRPVPIKAEEAETCEAAGIEFIELKVAVDGLSVVTSAEDEAITCLSFVDLYALLGPDATGVNNWADASATADEIAATVTDLGAVNTPFPDADLTVTAPGEESGTFDSFVELVITPVGEALGVEDANVRPDYTASPNDNVIIEGIAANPTSLGWVGFAFVEENLDVIKPIQVDGGAGCIEPTAETIASGEYPIARDLFIYVSVPALESNPALAPFVDFYIGEGIATLVGADEGQVPYVPLSDEDLAAQVAVWDAQETGTREG